MPIVMIAAGFLVFGVGLLGITGRFDVTVTRWLGPVVVDGTAGSGRGVTNLLFALVTLSGLMLTLGGVVDLTV